MSCNFENISQISDRIFSMAHDAMSGDEVPVASVICSMNAKSDSEDAANMDRRLESFIRGENIQGLRIIGEGINQIIKNKDPTAHGEMLAIRNACSSQNSERLTHSILITSLEPCVMCGGAAILSRLEAVIYFAPSLSGIGMKTLFEQNPVKTHAFNHYPALHQMKEYEAGAAELLRSFFRLKRSF